MTDQDGLPYNLATQTAGKLTLLYFGYTHCQSFCPTVVATLALALRSMPASQRSDIAFVFVTTDPARDTPAVLKAWLGQFNPSFVGLTAPIGLIEQAQVEAGVPQAVLPSPPTGDYQIDHSGNMLAFTTDGLAHLEYPPGVSAQREASDFGRLLEHGYASSS